MYPSCFCLLGVRMKLDRMIGILYALLKNEKVTASSLAEKFEVSVRTIYRDIDELCKAGYPIVSAQGQRGGISLMEGFKIDKTLLSVPEMQAILTGLRSLDSIDETSKSRLLIEKISGEKSDVSDAGSIIIDLSLWDKSRISAKIELIKSAIEDRKVISFNYFSPDGESHRIIEPYHLVFQWSSWYVWGYCYLRDDYRMFRLGRMTDLIATGEPVGDRDVPRYKPDKLLHGENEIEVSVRFDSSVKWRLADDFGAENIVEDENGNIILDFTWSDEPSLINYIMTFGERAEIIKPEGLRRQMAKQLKLISAKYET